MEELLLVKSVGSKRVKEDSSDSGSDIAPEDKLEKMAKAIRTVLEV